MTRDRLQTILNHLPDATVAVVGDFFLDRYWEIDPKLAEISIETGLPVHQVVGRRLSGGGAGNIVSNLRALGVGQVVCIGAIGDDGEGFELRRCIDATGADSSHLIGRRDLFTPCYTKPMRCENGRQTEMERIDIKNRAPLPVEVEDRVIAQVRKMLLDLDAVIIADQVQERNFGVITDRVREALCETAEKHPHITFFVDSRLRIGEYHSVITKPNMAEAVDAVRGGARADATGPLELNADAALPCALVLRERTGKPVFMTAQDKGVFVVDDVVTQVPAAPVKGEIDPVGAGDSCTSGIVSALCAKASLAEAAMLGNLVASVTVKKLGQTGTATPDEVLARFDQYAARG